MNDIGWFIGIVLILIVIWVLSDGPGSERSAQPFLRPPAPLDSGGQYGPPDLLAPVTQTRSEAGKEEESDTSSQEEGITKAETQISIFGGKVSFRGRGRAQENNPNKEYLEIIASVDNTQPVNISGWRLKSVVTGREATIGEGSYLPYSGRVNTELTIFLRPGERAFIVTGRSPLGVSFRLNTCTGYFEQFQDFEPRLPKDCPRPEDEDFPAGPNGLTDACVEYIEGLPRCQAHVQAIPSAFVNDPICQEYITKEITYNECVTVHKDDPDFYKSEWRIFLRRDQELWKEKRETILLLDDKKKTVSSISY